MTKVLTTKQRRTFRIRNKIRATAAMTGRPRLAVHRTGDNIYAQIIDDAKGVTLAAASSLDKDVKAKSGRNVAAATEVGTLVAERAKKAAEAADALFRSGAGGSGENADAEPKSKKKPKLPLKRK